MKPAVTDFVALMVTVHVVPETESHPLQLPKRRPGPAVRVTTVPLVYVSAQSAPQSIPGGLEVTLAWLLTRTVLPTVRTKRFRSKVAVAVLPEPTDTVHGAPATVPPPVRAADAVCL